MKPHTCSLCGEKQVLYDVLFSKRVPMKARYSKSGRAPYMSKMQLGHIYLCPICAEKWAEFMKKFDKEVFFE